MRCSSTAAANATRVPWIALAFCFEDFQKLTRRMAVDPVLCDEGESLRPLNSAIANLTSFWKTSSATCSGKATEGWAQHSDSYVTHYLDLIGFLSGEARESTEGMKKALDACDVETVEVLRCKMVKFAQLLEAARAAPTCITAAEEERECGRYEMGVVKRFLDVLLQDPRHSIQSILSPFINLGANITSNISSTFESVMNTLASSSSSTVAGATDEPTTLLEDRVELFSDSMAHFSSIAQTLVIAFGSLMVVGVCSAGIYAYCNRRRAEPAAVNVAYSCKPGADHVRNAGADSRLLIESDDD